MLLRVLAQYSRKSHASAATDIDPLTGLSSSGNIYKRSWGVWLDRSGLFSLHKN